MGGGGGEHLPSLADVSHGPGHISDRLLCCEKLFLFTMQRNDFVSAQNPVRYK